MATIENLESPHLLLQHLQAMSEPELVAQQIAQHAAIHMVTFLLANGCTEALAIQVLGELRSNDNVLVGVAEAKGFKRLFPAVPPNFN